MADPTPRKPRSSARKAKGPPSPLPAPLPPPPAPPPLVESVRIQGYKAARDLTVSFGRVTVLIGANGAGKSTILEALSLAAAAGARRLDNESLALRGVHASHPGRLRGGLAPYDPSAPITLTVQAGSATFAAELRLEGDAYPAWVDAGADRRELEQMEWQIRALEALLKEMKQRGLSAESVAVGETGQPWGRVPGGRRIAALNSFLVYAPQLPTLRALPPQAHLEPLGLHGEGLFRLLRTLTHDPLAKEEVLGALDRIEWFSGYETVEEGELRHIHAHDLYVDPAFGAIDELGANEGFRIVLFYACLLISPLTPRFFAIDNVDAGLNPKLAREAVALICRLAKAHDKQVILTTHSPSALDGMDLADDEQRLLVVRREPDGEIVANRVKPPRQPLNLPPVPLSEAFVRGYLGGLPTGF